VTESSAVPPDVTRSWRFTSLAKNPLCLVERDFQTQIDLSRSPVSVVDNWQAEV